MSLAELSRDISREEHLNGEQVQELAETFVAYFHREDKEEAWNIGNRLYWHFKPLIKDLLFGRKNKMNVEKTVWTSTIDREGREDMLSEGKVQFFELLTEYDPSSGVHFGVYIKRKLEFGIFNYLRNNSSFDNAIQTQDSLDELLKDNFSEVDGMDTEARKLLMKYMDENSQDIELGLLDEVQISNKHLALRVAWNSLNERQKEAVDLIVNKEYTLREAGSEMGIHHTTVREIKNTAFKKMEKIINKILKK
ncbi:sigma-70 family RNA polymerase sigma factor [Priestia endophytica]|uniref:sigma-70 family RNA polymerase sigma factor n=1 Tax=Priestia endophytica TaxID=135735 RepID=UPI003D2C1794